MKKKIVIRLVQGLWIIWILYLGIAAINLDTQSIRFVYIGTLLLFGTLLIGGLEWLLRSKEIAKIKLIKVFQWIVFICAFIFYTSGDYLEKHGLVETGIAFLFVSIILFGGLHLLIMRVRARLPVKDKMSHLG